jgi:hypothetical protein
MGGVRVEERGLDRHAGEQMLLLLHERKRDAGPLDLAVMIHPDAEMRLLITYGAVVRGRDQIVAALERAQRDAGLCEASVRRFEWLDDQTVLTFGRARYKLPAGFVLSETRPLEEGSRSSSRIQGTSPARLPPAAAGLGLGKGRPRAEDVYRRSSLSNGDMRRRVPLRSRSAGRFTTTPARRVGSRRPDSPGRRDPFSQRK